MLARPLLLLAPLLLTSPLLPEPSLAGVQLAVTVDDIPWVHGAIAGGQGAGTDQLLAHLAGVPTTGFVVCDRVGEGQPVLARWRAAGIELANHHADHGDLQKLGGDAWLAGARSCHERLTAWGDAPRFFRYPYLRNGGTTDKRDAVRGVLTGELKQTIARVTVDNHEWKYAQLYSQALAAGDTARADALAADYPGHMVRAVQHAVATADAKVGRPIPHVFLLHANTLNAHHLGTVLGELTKRGVEFVPLQKALADPVYAVPDHYTGKGGISWLYRIAPVTPSDGWTFENSEWQRLKDLFGSEPK